MARPPVSDPPGSQTRHFYLDDQIPIIEYLGRFRARGWESCGDPVRIERRFHDTFDWRLFRRNYVLEHCRDARSERLVLRRLGAERATAALPVRELGFVRALPPGRMRSLLEPIVTPRKLLPGVSVTTERWQLHRRNKNGKIVARVDLEDNSLALAREGNRIHLHPRAVLIPVRGYGKDGERTGKFLAGEMALPSAPDVLVEALALMKVRPVEITTKPQVSLVPTMPSWLATRKVLLRLLSVLELNEEGARDNVDSEFVHDFRIAVRSTRTILLQLKEVFQAEVLVRFKPEFSWLGTITGPARDLDVYLLQFDDFVAMVPRKLRKNLEPLRRYLDERCRDEHAKLSERLRSRRYENLKGQWRDYLQSDGPGEHAPAPARVPIIDRANGRIWKLFRRTMKQGAAVTDSSPPEALHELRKTCKKLRYLMEFFRSLYPPEDIRGLVKALKGMQDCLGAFQDCTVQAAALGRYREEFAHSEPRTVAAIDALIAAVLARRESLRAPIARQFASFGGKSNRRLFRRLFHPALRAGEAGEAGT